MVHCGIHHKTEHVYLRTVITRVFIVSDMVVGIQTLSLNETHLLFTKELVFREVDLYNIIAHLRRLRRNIIITAVSQGFNQILSGS